MTLIKINNGISDRRMIDFYGDVSRLGEERSSAQEDLDAVRSDSVEIGGRNAELLLRIDEARKELDDLRFKIAKEISEGAKKLSDILRDQQLAEVAIGKKSSEINQLESCLASIKKMIGIEEDTLIAIKKRVEEVSGLLDVGKKSLDVLTSEKISLEKDIDDLQGSKAELAVAIHDMRDLWDRMSDKEQFLNRKETDLIKYEKRVEQLRDDLGIKTKMKFI